MFSRFSFCFFFFRLRWSLRTLARLFEFSMGTLPDVQAGTCVQPLWPRGRLEAYSSPACSLCLLPQVRLRLDVSVFSGGCVSRRHPPSPLTGLTFPSCWSAWTTLRRGLLVRLHGVFHGAVKGLFQEPSEYFCPETRMPTAKPQWRPHARFASHGKVEYHRSRRYNHGALPPCVLLASSPSVPGWRGSENLTLATA